MSLDVQIPDTFSGPLDLLLHLVRRDEMDIYDIPIARLAAAYMQELSKLDLVNVDEASEFLDIASRLVEIKSRMLLPEEERDDAEDEAEEFDPRDGLVKALLEYRRFKEAADLLRGLAETQARRYPRIAPLPALDAAEEPGESLGGEDLFAAFQALFFRLVPRDGADEVTYTEVPTTVRIGQIENVLAATGNTRFSLLLSDRPSRAEIVGFFIAMLELIRQGRLIARQGDPYGDIVLEVCAPESDPRLPEAGGVPRPARQFAPAKRGFSAAKRKNPPFPAAAVIRRPVFVPPAPRLPTVFPGANRRDVSARAAKKRNNAGFSAFPPPRAGG